MKRTILLFNTIFILTLITVSCKSDIIKCSDETQFCASVGQSDINNALPIINQYLSNQKKNLSDNEKLEQLRGWLDCKSCISSVEILCISCIETNPQQSELNVVMLINSEKVERKLDILMETPLRATTFHE